MAGLALGPEAGADQRAGKDRPAPQADATRCFGDYELLEEIARGGMGVVYKARQASLNRLVALKMILGGRFASPDVVRRFQMEAEAAAKLDHGNIVPIYEIGEQEDQHYFSMRLIEGRSLGEVNAQCQTRDVEWLRRTAKLVATVARAVHYAHQRGVLHRDLKPGNILLDSKGEPHVTDFGLARLLDQEAGLTQSEAVLGTPAFMAPEQASGRTKTVTTAADVYSLGAILYVMATGQALFRAENAAELVRKVIDAEPRTPRALNPCVDADLETICLKCLSKEPQARYRSAETLAEDLQRWLRGEPILARPVPVWERLGKWMRRHPLMVGLLAAVSASVILSFVGVKQWRRAEAQRLEREQLESRRRLQTAEDHIARDHLHLGLRTLTDLLRERPENRAAGERLMNALNQRTYLVRVTNAPPLPVGADDFSSDGMRQVRGKGTNAIEVIDVRTSQVLLAISNAHSRVIRSVRFSPDTRYLISAAADSNAVIWNAKTGAKELTLSHLGAVYYAEFNGDGTRVATASRDKTAGLWDVRDGRQIGLMHHENLVRTARFDANAGLIVTASDDHTMRVWDGETGLPVSEPARLHTAVIDARFARDRHIIAVTMDEATNTFVIVEAAAWEIATPQETAFASAAPAAVNVGKIAELRKKVAAHFARESLCLDVSPDGRIAAAGFADGSALLFETAILRPHRDPLIHDAKVNSLRFSPDGLRLVTSTSTGRVRVWDVASGQPLTDPDQCPRSITAAGFSSDGEWVVSSAGLKFEIAHLAGPAPLWLAQLGDAIATNGTVHGILTPDKLVHQGIGGTNQLARWGQKFATPPEL